MLIKAFIIIVWCPLASCDVWPQSILLISKKAENHMRVMIEWRLFLGKEKGSIDDPHCITQTCFLMRTSFLHAQVNRQFKYRKREKIARNFSSFFRLFFNLPAFFALYSLPSVASSISSFGIMMKFLGNWVKCALHTETLFYSSSLFCLFIKCIFYCNSFIPLICMICLCTGTIFSIKLFQPTKKIV